MKISLLRTNRRAVESPTCRFYHLKESLPFVQSHRKGRRPGYVHRPRSARLIVTRFASWVHVEYWCGGCANIHGKPKRGAGGAAFVEAPEFGRVVCATCEGRAIGTGLMGAPVIAGRPVRFSPRIGR